jgi:hypothetical protein
MEILKALKTHPKVIQKFGYKSILVKTRNVMNLTLFLFLDFFFKMHYEKNGVI